MDQGVSHTPVRGGLIPQLSYNTHGFSGKGGTEGKGREGEREGERKREGKGPQGLVDTPHVPNPEKYPVMDPCVMYIVYYKYILYSITSACTYNTLQMHDIHTLKKNPPRYPGVTTTL